MENSLPKKLEQNLTSRCHIAPLSLFCKGICHPQHLKLFGAGPVEKNHPVYIGQKIKRNFEEVFHALGTTISALQSLFISMLNTNLHSKGLMCWFFMTILQNSSQCGSISYLIIWYYIILELFDTSVFIIFNFSTNRVHNISICNVIPLCTCCSSNRCISKIHRCKQFQIFERIQKP